MNSTRELSLINYMYNVSPQGMTFEIQIFKGNLIK